MKKLVLIALICILGWLGYDRYRQVTQEPSAPVPLLAEEADTQVAREIAMPTSGQFTCDGRKHCSQMHSCSEAKYFLKNCPGVEMDGDGDGIPCERQWCE